MADTVKVHNFPCVIGMQPSPFGLKLETWLRIAGLPYEQIWSFTQLGPKGKVPFITLDGQKIGDSELIVQILAERTDRDPDRQLNMQERAKGILIRRLVEEELYFILLYSRWQDMEVWPKFSQRVFSGVPFVMRGFVKASAQKSVRKAIHAQGISRHTSEEIYAKAERDFEALSIMLGNQAFIHGEMPGLTDASLYGLLANIYYQPDEGQLQRSLRSFDNLVGYVKRLKEMYFRDSERGGGDQISFEPLETEIISQLKSA
ncbi:glutathione S-transferase family protein [Sneathiella glossodoripedis]|uniref:glutathione S-transferase family protein n=1 Tax=Sneathiella glossodoripedis TaxID=418853 RepID=UPI00047028DE|nr:glutathione S-transferase family protein [Sneathiella glossodoripedis]